jgi:hypothetical protein
MKESVLALVVMSAIAGVARAEPTPEACASFKDFVATACPLTWHGITLYGAYDVGVGWVSHGLPENGYNYEGESLINRNGNHSQWVLAPNNLQQTGLGIKGKIEFMADWYAVFKRFDRLQSAVRPVRQHGSHQHHEQRPTQVRLFGNRRRCALGPSLQ